MALIKFGALIDTIKGEIGSAVIQGGRYGSIIKVNAVNNKKKGVKASTLQRTRRQSLAYISKKWKSLTDAQRLTWDDMLTFWTFINKFGAVWNGTAYMIFCNWNLNLQFLYGTYLDGSPTYTALFNPAMVISSYSIEGDFTTQNTDIRARGQRFATFLTFPTYSSNDVNHLQFYYFAHAAIANENAISRKAVIAAIPNFNPVVGQFFYFKIFTFHVNYPKLSFETLYKIEIIA